MPTTYVMGDIQQIQAYIFASPRLLEIRRASTMIDFFDHRVVPHLIELQRGTAIFHGGGNFIARFEGSEGVQRATVFENDIRTAFLDLTGGHGLTVIRYTCFEDHGFSKILSELQRALRRAKEQPEDCQPQVSMPFLKRCESCGQETADGSFRRPGASREAPREWLGQSCGRKRLLHQAVQEAHHQAPRFPVYIASEGVTRTLPVPVIANLIGDTDPPVNFQDMVGDDDLAIFVADGNNLGSWFDRLDEDDYRQLSADVVKAMRRSLEAAHKSLPPEVQFQTLICGGDDLVVALPGRYALRFARTLLKNFDVRHPKNGEVAGIAGGLLFCRAGFPFRPAHHLAEELLAQAKDCCREEGGPPWALALHRATASHVRNLREEQASLERFDGRSKGWSYGAAGPYGPDALEALLDLAQKLRSRVSASQRGRLRDILTPNGDGPHTPLHPDWKIPARVVAKLRTWLLRQDPAQLPFEWPSGTPPTTLVRQVQIRQGNRPVIVQRLALGDALLLANYSEKGGVEP